MKKEDSTSLGDLAMPEAGPELREPPMETAQTRLLKRKQAAADKQPLPEIAKKQPRGRAKTAKDVQAKAGTKKGGSKTDSDHSMACLQAKPRWRF